ncbi:MAG: hypothetical protein GTN53_16700, partial [Candidatus Aminicenantes bacterium]|nr:hypothetical protein [Candidatus Aminicenantes bacterium]NIQ68093.1 hypothetical protein [Candidatus Aminicenantes bacterium]NIT24136.1 hypothetical protein [Candidatus Aminicenantes bacterium]
LRRDFISLLRGQELPGLPLQYKDYSEWQNRDEIKESIRHQAEYWLKEFAGEITLLDLPLDYERTGKMSFEGNSFSFTIDDILTSRIKKCALEFGVTLMMFLFSVYKLLLAWYACQEEVIVGTVVGGRQDIDLENIIGFFVNMLAIKTNPNKNKTFSEYLGQVKEKILEAHENQEFQFEELVSKLNIQRQPGRHPLVEVVFAFWEREDSLIGERKDRDSSLNFNLFNISHFDLMLHTVTAAGLIQMRLEYCTR